MLKFAYLSVKKSQTQKFVQPRRPVDRDWIFVYHKHKKKSEWELSVICVPNFYPASSVTVRCSWKVYPQKRKVMGYPEIPGALFDSSHRRRYVESNGPAALHRLPLFFVYLQKSGELWVVGAKWHTYVSHGLGLWRTKNKILGTQVCDSQTQITNLCLCNTNTNFILGTLHCQLPPF